MPVPTRPYRPVVPGAFPRSARRFGITAAVLGTCLVTHATASAQEVVVAPAPAVAAPAPAAPAPVVAVPPVAAPSPVVVAPATPGVVYVSDPRDTPPTVVAPAPAAGSPVPVPVPAPRPVVVQPVVVMPTLNEPVDSLTTRTKYRRDPGRTGALIASPIVYGLGASIAGTMYLATLSHSSYTGDRYASTRTGALVAYAGISAAVPSLPRFVVGDATTGLLYAAARGGAIAAASVIDWGKADANFVGPMILGFVVPTTLAIVDMATTPHAEDLEDQPPPPPRTGIRAITPAPVADRQNGTTGATVSVFGTF